MLDNGKLFVITGKQKVGKTSFALHLYTQLCIDETKGSHSIITYSIKNDFLIDFEDIELLKIVADYQLLKNNCDVIFFDIKFKNELEKKYFSNEEIWQKFFTELKKEITNVSASVVVILPIPFKDEVTSEQSLEEDIESVLNYYNQADQILLLNRPTQFKNDELFGTTFLNLINTSNKKTKRIRYKADFKKHMFELY